MNPQKPMRLYKIVINALDPKYEGFEFVDDSPVLGSIDVYDDFLPADCREKGMDWTPPRFGSAWKVKKVFGNKRNNHDFPNALGVLILSSKAVNALRDVFEPVAELLPVSTEKGDFFAINVFKKIDVIDYGKSSRLWDWKEMNEFETTLAEFVVDETQLESNAIFRVPQDISGIYVTQTFVDRVKAAELIGLVVEQIYPVDKGAYQLSSNVSQSVVIRLGFPANEEQKSALQSLKRYSRKADRYLESQAEYAGSFEESEFNDHEGRIFFSCPDRQHLANVLAEWVETIRFNGEIELVLRNGHYDMKEAEETTIRLR